MFPYRGGAPAPAVPPAVGPFADRVPVQVDAEARYLQATPETPARPAPPAGPPAPLAARAAPASALPHPLDGGSRARARAGPPSESISAVYRVLRRPVPGFPEFMRYCCVLLCWRLPVTRVRACAA
jgi:hypothetical protein